MEKVTMNCKMSSFFCGSGLPQKVGRKLLKNIVEFYYILKFTKKELEVWQVGVLNYVNYNIKLCFLEEFGFYLTGCDHHDLGGVKLKQNITSIS